MRGFFLHPLYSLNADTGICSCGNESCKSAGKEPRLPKWPEHASNHPGRIRTWTKKYPDANFGIACGKSNVLVLDEDAPGEFARLCDDVGIPVPDTFTVATGKPGCFHYYFDQADISTADRIGCPPFPGYEIDVKGKGGNVVAPGSVHRTGAVYTIANDVDPQPLPIEIASQLAAPRISACHPSCDPKIADAFRTGSTDSIEISSYGRAALTDEVKKLRDTPHGNRNNQLNKGTFVLAQLIVSGDLTEAVIREEMGNAARAVGHDEDRITRALDSAIRSGKLQPRTDVPELRAGTSKGSQGENMSDDEKYVADRIHRLELDDEATRRFREKKADGQFREPEWTATLRDEIALPDSGPRFAISQLLVMGGNALISAQRKTGKTVLSMNLAKSYADQEPFLGRFDVAPLSEGGRILVLNYELTQSQFVVWSKQLQIKNPDRITALHLRGQGFSLASPAARKWLIELAKRNSVEAIIIDPYSRARKGFGKSNDNDDTSEFTDTLDSIKFEAGIRDLFMTNHMGWGEEERSRGASALEDWPDALWRLTKKDDQRYFSAPLGRGIELAEGKLSWDPETQWVTYEDGGRNSKSNSELEQRVSKFIADNPGCGTREIEEGVNPGSKEDIGKAKKRLKDTGAIRTEVDGRKVKHYVSAIEIKDGRYLSS